MASFPAKSYVWTRVRMRLRSSFALGFGLAAISCGGGASSPVDDNANVTSADLGVFELNLDAVDRFRTCPPVGTLNDPWIPAIHEEGSSSGIAWHEPGVTDRAITETLVPFRSCYRRGLVHDPTQAGHVAVVARVGADGKVAKVETYAACELSREVLECMADSAHDLKFDPPASGHDSVVVPVSYEPRGGRLLNPASDRSSYASQAYRLIEAARPALHACEKSEMEAGRMLDAAGTYRIDVDGRGHVVKENIDPWNGNQQLLACGARALQNTAFPTPPTGRGIVFVRLVFDPRKETR